MGSVVWVGFWRQAVQMWRGRQQGSRDDSRSDILSTGASSDARAAWTWARALDAMSGSELGRKVLWSYSRARRVRVSPKEHEIFGEPERTIVDGGDIGLGKVKNQARIQPCCWRRAWIWELKAAVWMVTASCMRLHILASRSVAGQVVGNEDAVWPVTVALWAVGRVLVVLGAAGRSGSREVMARGTGVIAITMASRLIAGRGAVSGVMDWPVEVAWVVWIISMMER